jgi:hypothetical protein
MDIETGAAGGTDGGGNIVGDGDDGGDGGGDILIHIPSTFTSTLDATKLTCRCRAVDSAVTRSGRQTIPITSSMLTVEFKDRLIVTRNRFTAISPTDTLATPTIIARHAVSITSTAIC